MGEPLVVPDSEELGPHVQDPESGWVLVGGFERVGWLDPDTGTIEEWEAPTGIPVGAALSPDGSRAAFVTETDGVQLYDVATGTRLGVAMGPDGLGPVASGNIAWTDDGMSVWISPWDGPMRFAAHPDSWRAIACEIVGRALTDEEWTTYVSSTDPHLDACDP